MIITNFKRLAKNPLRRKTLLIAEAGYRAIEISRVIQKKIKVKKNRLIINSASINGGKKMELGLNDYQRIFLVGIGKGSGLACSLLEKILGKKLTAGIALDTQKPGFRLQASRFRVLTGTHPMPSKQNVKGAKKIMKLAKDLKENDLLINLICGGGSALFCGSEEELKHSCIVFEELTKVGADIFELNTVRKHLSETKGGGLAKLAYPATTVSLIVSDVLGNDLSMVASGPTVFDKTTKKDAERILNKYLGKTKIIRFLKETPKQKKYFKKVKNVLLLSNREPIMEMEEKAGKMGFKTKIYSLKVKGEARKSLLPLIKLVKKNKVILAAGETTVTLTSRPQGKGGRNTEAVLGAIVKSLDTKYPIPDTAIISFSSDGRDNSEAAGAIADISTVKKAEKMKLNPKKYLNKNDSFIFFKKTGDLIFTKSKTFNVADFMLVIK